MKAMNILDFKHRNDFRNWLSEYCATEKECWLPVKRGKAPPVEGVWYLDAVEEALCFGWIDSILKNLDCVLYQRFGPRRKGSRWTELNKERCRRLEKLGLMTEEGRKVCPDLNEDFIIEKDILEIFISNPIAWSNFQSFPSLYQKVRIDNIQRVRGSDFFESRLAKLIEASEEGKMIGDWNDYGRLVEY